MRFYTAAWQSNVKKEDGENCIIRALFLMRSRAACMTLTVISFEISFKRGCVDMFAVVVKLIGDI